MRTGGCREFSWVELLGYLVLEHKIFDGLDSWSWDGPLGTLQILVQVPETVLGVFAALGLAVFRCGHLLVDPGQKILDILLVFAILDCCVHQLLEQRLCPGSGLSTGTTKGLA